MTVHNFADSLAKSHKYANAPWWGDVYRAAFGAGVEFYCVRQDGWAQRGGIDRIIVLPSGKTFNVDEKVRDKVWPDIALERWSDRKRRVPGWIQKPLATDFIAYAFIPSRECLLLPFHTLRCAWLKNGRDWCAAAESGSDGFKVILAENEGYQTESIGVPRDVLFASLTDAMCVGWA